MTPSIACRMCGETVTPRADHTACRFCGWREER